MIVKNESHIIQKTLNNICDKINLDYYVICDTGSTDNTVELILDFFKNKNINGEIHYDIWRDFGYNRTKSLEYAYNKTDYGLIFDADDYIVGNINLNTENLDKDGYYLHFGNKNCISYSRILLINNKIKWKYVGVLHEYIECIENNPNISHIDSDYYIISGRSGSRNKDMNKYLNDALILEKAHKEALLLNDTLYLRYAFYCANSYYDFKCYDKAIEWYKITLKQNNWYQEKYIACKNLYECYNAINEKETGIFYLIESFKYDNERCECLYYLITYYLWNNMSEVAYNFYNNFKNFIENDYLVLTKKSNNIYFQNKLFLEIDKINFFVPYYMILVADKVKKYETVANMFKIILTKKTCLFSDLWIGNVLYNLQFFIDHCILYVPNFIDLLNEYFIFLEHNNFNYYKYNFLKKFQKYNIKINFTKLVIDNKENITQQLTEKDNNLYKCKESNNILIYTGYSTEKWNITYENNNALGGSETAVINLAKTLSTKFNIYIYGDVDEEKYDNIIFINIFKNKNLIKNIYFHTIIISRYLNFFEIHNELLRNTYNIYIWAHDTSLLDYGCDLNSEEIINKYSRFINGCICLTQWHKELYEIKYPQLKDKIHIINNGIDTKLFIYNCDNKIKNKFIYSSCSERGLTILLNIWPSILKLMPNSQLTICSYNNFPQNKTDYEILNKINTYKNIKHIGKLSKAELYKEMASSEYWLFPSIFPETSCITALEMLMSKVLCIYYPYAGLPYTIDKYGIKISKNNELAFFQNFEAIERKDIIHLIEQGRSYAESCSWENRVKLWCDLILS